MQHIAVNSNAVRLFAAAGIITAIPTVVVSTAVHRPSQSAVPVALTSVDVSGAEGFLDNPPTDIIPGSFLTTAAGELRGVYSDAPLVFHDAPTALAHLSWDQTVGLMTIGQLSSATVLNATNFVSAAGDYTPATGPTADVNVADDTTATQLFTGAINEANIETASLQNVLHLLASQYPLPSLGITDQVGVTGDLVGFQQDINGSLNALNNALDPTTLSGYDSNGFLDAMLHGLLVSETNMNDLAGAVLTAMNTDDPATLAAIDPGMLTNALAEYGYAQGIIAFFTLENALDDVGGWLAALS